MSRLFLKQVLFHSYSSYPASADDPLSICFFYLKTNYRSKTIILRFDLTTFFSSFDIKRFPRPLYRRVLLRLAENKREKSLNEAEN